jgi:membrane-bound lytic murein transglycosylase A
MKIKQFWVYILFAVLATGCSTKAPRVVHLEPISFTHLEGWRDDSHKGALDAFKHSCKRILNLDWETEVSRATSLGGAAIDWQVPCMEALQHEYHNDDQARKFFEKWFTPYRVFDEEGNHEGHLTGYFQIELEGSRKKHGKYQYPVYRKPQNLHEMKGSSALTHAAINRGALTGQGLEVVYVDNKARLYMMHVQGSGVIKLKEGGHVNLGFEDHNGYRFRGLSEAIRKRNLKFEDSTAMLRFLHHNKQLGAELMEEDPSYVFFRPVEGDGAIGGHGVPLKQERSLAVDYELYPYGLPIWVDTKLPQQSIFKGREYKRLFIAQDTGGVIRGAVRGDVFFGRGLSAEKVASQFKTKARFFALFPKTVQIPGRHQSR